MTIRAKEKTIHAAHYRSDRTSVAVSAQHSVGIPGKAHDNEDIGLLLRTWVVIRRVWVGGRLPGHQQAIRGWKKHAGASGATTAQTKPQTTSM